MLPDYIQNKIIALKDLLLWSYLSDEEKEALRQAPNEPKSDILMRTFIHKYYDTMIDDYENKLKDVPTDISVLDMELKTKTKNSLMRKGLYTSAKAIDFIKRHGWSSIPLFGANSAKDLYMQIYDKSEKEINKLVKDTRYVTSKGE